MKKKGQKSFNIKNRAFLISSICITFLAFMIYQSNFLALVNTKSMLLLIIENPLYIPLFFSWTFYGFFLTRKKMFKKRINNEQKIKVGIYVLIFTFFVFYQALFLGIVPITFASTTAGCGVYSGSGDWTISSSCTISGGQCVTVVNGNLIITGSGTLTLTNANSRIVINTAGKYVSIASGGLISFDSAANTCIKFVSSGSCATVTTCP